MSSVHIFENTKAALLSLRLSLETVDPSDKATTGIWVEGFSNALEDANNTSVAARIDIEADPEIVAFTAARQAAWDAQDATKAAAAAGVSGSAATSPAVQSPVPCPLARLLPSLSSWATSPADVLRLLEMAQTGTLPLEEYERQCAGLLAASQGSATLLISPSLSLKVLTGSQRGSQYGLLATSAPSTPSPSSLLLRQVEPAPSGSPAAMFSPAPAPSSPTLLASAVPAATAASRPTRCAAASAAAVWSSQIPSGSKRGCSPDIELVAVSKAVGVPPFACDRCKSAKVRCEQHAGTGPEVPCLQCHWQKISCTQDGLPRCKVSACASALGAGASGTTPTPLPSVDSKPLPLLPKMLYDLVAFDLLHQSICVKAQLRALRMQEHWVDQMYLKSLKQALFLTSCTPKHVKQDTSVASGSSPTPAKGKGKVKAAAAMVEDDPSVVIDVNDPDASGPSGESWPGIADAGAS
ncbi:hypothetical protein EI94DRAFT_1711679 [Lactarius quietus]|nr:hypothetical protein EI94DRAFT_1711679 [Lactarius quietus]